MRVKTLRPLLEFEMDYIKTHNVSDTSVKYSTGTCVYRNYNLEPLYPRLSRDFVDKRHSRSLRRLTSGGK